MWIMHKGVRLRLGRHWVTSKSLHLLFLWGLWFYVVCILVGWVIVDAVGWVYVTHLLCEGVGIVLWDGGGSYLCKRLCFGVTVASGM